MNIKIKVSPEQVEVELPLVDIPIFESVIECVARLFEQKTENPEPELKQNGLS